MTSSDGVEYDDEQFRRELIARGVPTRDPSPLPGDEARAALALARIIAKSPDPGGDPGAQHHSTARRASTAQQHPRMPLHHKVAARRRRARLAAMPAVAAVTVLLAVLFMVVQPGGGGHVAQAGTPPLLQLGGVEPGTLPASGEPAGDLLRGLAAKALDLPYDHTQPVQHVVVDAWLSQSDVENGDGAAQSVMRSVQRESYFLPDDTFRSVERRGEPLDQNGRLTDSLGEEAPVRTDESFPSPDPGADHATSLPTDPAALREALLDGYDASTLTKAPGGALLGQITSLTNSYVLAPRLLSAIWEVLAEEPSVTHLGTAHDRLGREALIFSTPALDGHSQDLLLADPDTGAILGAETVLVKPTRSYSFTPPAVTSFTTIVLSERIASADVPPAP